MIGASGWIGGEIMREALSRGHEVTAIARHPDRIAELDGVQRVAADCTDPASIEAAIKGHDIVVAAVTDRSGPDRSSIPAAAKALIEAVPKAGVPRLVFMGGGGSLTAPGGGRFVDKPDFPEEYKPEALAQAEALRLLKAAPWSLDWAYLSPPPRHLEQGEKHGGYRVRGGNHPAVDDNGEGSITSGDLASAMVDELERHRFARERFTAEYERPNG